MAESIEQLSYQLTADALAEQERALLGLRTRAGTVLAAASIAGAFLGAKTNHGSLDVWASLALIAFVLCVASAVWSDGQRKPGAWAARRHDRLPHPARNAGRP